MKDKRALDEWAKRIVDEPDHYSTALFIGVGRYAKRVTHSLDAARTAGAELLAENPGGFQRPMIYAVSAEGVSIHVE